MNNNRVMYKSKLQQLSQQRGWGIPTYEVTNEGQEHTPHFRATVNVDATLFSTPLPSSSTEKAQNDAAKLAYNYFSDHSRASSSSPLDGMLHLFKNRLQTYAQKRNFSLPVYSCEREGPPHAIRFKCNVTVNGQTYESREYFPTLNKAENAAAKAALMSLLPNGVEEDESGYKNLLQDMAQREGFGSPTYCTEKSGEAHAPTFISTVKIDGASFTGKEARTKKQAEMSAAKAAYTARRR